MPAAIDVMGKFMTINQVLALLDLCQVIIAIPWIDRATERRARRLRLRLIMALDLGMTANG